MKCHIIALCVLLCFVVGCTPKTDETPAVSNQNTQEQSLDELTAKTEEKPSEPKQNTQEQSQDELTSKTEEKPSEPNKNTPEQSLDELTANTIQATITMEDGGEIIVDLYPDLAPQSVRNFVYLARQGFYDGLKFHRIIKDFMIQGGDPNGIGSGGPGYSIKGEFQQNGFKNDLKHTRGVLSMARSNIFNSAGSQFFIMHADAPSLDGAYAAFGRVTSGMDVVDRLADTPNSGTNGAVADENKPVIKSITIDNDIELPEPDMIK